MRFSVRERDLKSAIWVVSERVRAADRNCHMSKQRVKPELSNAY